jgi:hypothetical protein
MTSPPGFTVDVDQNPYLPAGGRAASAVVTVTADGTIAVTDQRSRAEARQAVRGVWPHPAAWWLFARLR